MKRTVHLFDNMADGIISRKVYGAKMFTEKSV